MRASYCRTLSLACALVVALGPAAAPAQTVLNGGGALSGEGGAKRLTVPQSAPAPDVAEADEGGPGLAARAGAFFRSMTGRDTTETEVLTGEGGSEADAANVSPPGEGETPEQVGVSGDMLQDAPEPLNTGGLVEQVTGIDEARDAALNRAAAMGRLMSDMDQAQGAEARANRLAEEARRAALPPTEAETLFAEFGRQPRAQSPFEASLEAAGFVRETEAPATAAQAVVAADVPAPSANATTAVANVPSSSPDRPSVTSPTPNLAPAGAAAVTASPERREAAAQEMPNSAVGGTENAGDTAASQDPEGPAPVATQVPPVAAQPPAAPAVVDGGWTTAPGRALAAAEGLGERLAQRFLGVPPAPSHSQPGTEPAGPVMSGGVVMALPVRSATHSMEPTPPIFQNADGSWPEPSADERTTLIFMARTMFEVCRAELYPDGSFDIPTF